MMSSFLDGWARGSFQTPLQKCLSTLCYNVADTTGTNGAATFANRKPLAFFHGHRRDERNFHGYIVTRHHHFDALRQNDRAGHVAGTEIKLRTVIRKERCV